MDGRQRVRLAGVDPRISHSVIQRTQVCEAALRGGLTCVRAGSSVCAHVVTQPGLFPALSRRAPLDLGLPN